MRESLTESLLAPVSDLAAPGPGWTSLMDAGTGYLSFFYSEPLARFPVRQLTKPSDNKSDPNIETGTYGLFSTCEPGMRNRIVADGAATIFFVSPHAGRARAIAGYYVVGWYTLGQRGAASKDWALAARHMRFVAPIPLSALVDQAPEAGRRFRTQLPLCAASVHALRAAVDSRPDLTSRYASEVRRVERFAASRTGYAYPSWGRTEGFTRSDGPSFLSAGGAAPNSSPNHRWACKSCQRVIPNQARLRKCPACHQVGTLFPV